MGCCGWNTVHKTPTVPRVPPPTDDRTVIALRRAHAEVALHDATGGKSLCRVDGPDVGRVKHAEGRLAAIAEVERTLRSSGAGAPDVTAQVLERWRAESGRAAGRGAAWEAYHAGGIAELEAVTRELMAPGDRTTSTGSLPTSTSPPERGCEAAS